MLRASCRQAKTLSFLLSVRCFSSALHVAVITGTTRQEGPPTPVIGPRVAQMMVRRLEERGNQVSLVDPRDLQLPLLNKPAFAYSKSQIPDQLRDLQDTLQAADAYVAITPEYNHAPSPALLNVLNHFGSSVFSYKPSAIISYSAGQWGGSRAAVALRPVLSELGCLPVSAMIHVPNAATTLDEEGFAEDQERWNKYLDRCVSQLEWWAAATKQHRAVVDPFARSPAFRTTPTERDAPKT